MKRFQNRNKVNPPVIKEDSKEQRNISSPEDLQPALQHVAQPNVAAARKTGIGSRIVRGIRAAGRNIRRFFKPKKIVKKATEDPSGVNDVLSTRDRETAPRATTEDNHQTPTTQPSHGSSNSDIKGKSCEVMPKTSAIEDQPHTVIPGTIGTTTMKPSSPVPSNNTTKDWSHAVVPNTIAMKDQSNYVLLRNVDLWDWPDESCAVVTDTGVMKDQSCPVVSNTYTMKDQSNSDLLRNVDLWDCPDESCEVVTDTGVMKDQSCPVVSNTYTMKEQFCQIFNNVAVNKSAFWIPYETYTTTDHNPSTPVPSNSSKKSISPTVVTKTGAMKDPSLPVPSNSTKKVQAYSVLAYTHDKRDWSCAVVVLKKVDNKLRVHTVLYKLDAKKSWSYAGLPNIGTWKDQSPALLPNASAMKACSSTVLPSITDNTMNQKSSIPVLTERLAVVTKTGTMKGQSHIKVLRTVPTKDQSNACAIKDQSLAALPNVGAIKDQSLAALPNAGAIKDQSLAALPNAGTIKDQSLAALPNAGAIKHQSLAALPNAGAIKHQSLAALPNAVGMKDQPCSVALITPGEMKNQYGLAMEKGFSFLKLLGQGTFGKVMLASHPATSKMLAVKVVDMNYYPNPSLYLMEAHLMKEVRDNPFIIHLYDSFQSKDQLFLVMEYLSGGDLFQLIKNSAPLPEDTLRNLTADILCGLEFLHSKNIVHRDIKPDNILLDDNGRAKIADLGESMKDVSEYRRIREFAGTLPYMAPEVLQKIPYYTLADYFSLGVIVYQMAVGKHPFWTGQKTAQEMLKAVRSKKVYIPPRLNRHLRDLIERLLDNEQVTRKIQVRDLRRHPFFRNFNWAKIQKGSPHPKIDFGSVKPEIDLRAEPVRRRRQDRTSITQIPGFSLSGW